MHQKHKKERGGGKETSPPPLPSFLFGSHLIFRASNTPKIPLLGISLLPNPTETVATYANLEAFELFPFVNTPFTVPINLHVCCPREWKHFIVLTKCTWQKYSQGLRSYAEGFKKFLISKLKAFCADFPAPHLHASCRPATNTISSH